MDFFIFHHLFLGPRFRWQSIFVLCSAIFCHFQAKFVFLLCAPSPLVFNDIFSKLIQNIPWAMVQTQYITATHYLILWPLGVQLFFYCALYRAEFPTDFDIFTVNSHQTKMWTPIYFYYSLDTFVTTRGPTSFCVCVLSNPRFFTLITNIGWTKVQIPIHFHHSEVTGVATWVPGPKE